jgi:hypothetical protein
MRRIDVGDGLELGFPGRSAEFREGFEIGILAAALICGAPQLALRVGVRAIPQAADLASGLGYSMERASSVVDDEADAVDFVFIDQRRRQRLRLVKG